MSQEFQNHSAERGGRRQAVRSVTMDCFTKQKSSGQTSGRVGWDHIEEGSECQVKEFRLSPLVSLELLSIGVEWSDVCKTDGNRPEERM